MKNFDLEAAKRGAAVCTRDGMEVRIVCFDRVDLEYPILGLRKNKAGVEYIFSYTLDGFTFNECIGEEDLMMRDDDYLEKLERGEYQSGQIRLLYENPSNSMGLNLTKREWFAGMAMQGIFAGRNWPHKGMISDCIGYARNAVELADALIEELEKTEK